MEEASQSLSHFGLAGFLSAGFLSGTAGEELAAAGSGAASTGSCCSGMSSKPFKDETSSRRYEADTVGPSLPGNRKAAISLMLANCQLLYDMEDKQRTTLYLDLPRLY